MPTISWKRAEGASFGRKVDMNTASGILEIPYFQLEDAGMYECVAENNRGRNSVRGKLSFYGEWSRPFLEAPCLPVPPSQKASRSFIDFCRVSCPVIHRHAESVGLSRNEKQ